MPWLVGNINVDSVSPICWTKILIFLILIRLETWAAGLHRPAWNIKSWLGLESSDWW